MKSISSLRCENAAPGTESAYDFCATARHCPCLVFIQLFAPCTLLLKNQQFSSKYVDNTFFLKLQHEYQMTKLSYLYF